MITMTESKVSCIHDGYNVFIVKREFDVGIGEPQVEVICRRCNPAQYMDALRHAHRIVLLQDNIKENPQRLKTQ